MGGGGWLSPVPLELHQEAVLKDFCESTKKLRQVFNAVLSGHA